MANELTVTAGLKFSKGTGDALVNISEAWSDLVTVTGTEVNDNIYSIGTDAEAIPLGDVGTAGYVLIRNLDSTNFVTISTDASAHANPCVKLLAGEIAVFRAAAAPYAKADTGACRCRVLVIET